MNDSYPLFQVDAFTDRPFSGNPAAVCLLDAAAADSWMQDVAAEMNLAETAFLHPRAGGSYGLRWFTPTVEVDLCGHATLASAHVLWEEGLLAQSQPAVFFTRSGTLTCRRRADWIEMDFPTDPARACEAPPGLREGLGVPVSWVGMGKSKYLVEVLNEAVLRAAKPDFGLIAALPAMGVIVTCRAADPAFDFVSRFFAPAVGINEDPVTGSAHCTLAPYWSERLGRQHLTGYQASRRGGVVGVELNGERVRLLGQAVTVSRGWLLVSP